jgi:acetolactate synthase-1/3 small subunit
VSKTEDSTVSRIVMTVNDDDCILEQITKQLNKQIDIIEVTNFSDIKYI